jgi:predicted DNA binding CopG/RHH family protein
MAHSPWKKLAVELQEQGIESKYIARIQARVTPEQRLENVEAEILQEIAGALGRSEDRVNLALAECELLAARHAQAHGLERRELARAFNAQRVVARARLRDLLIHREAAGFRRNQMLNELYPIPGALDEEA